MKLKTKFQNEDFRKGEIMPSIKKFRAWEKNPEDDVAHFIYNVVVGENVSYRVLGNSGFVQKMNDDDFVIEQYIGQTDKNGKEIYEGDIVNVYTPKGEKYTGVVEYAISWYYVSVNEHYGVGLYDTVSGDTEVIGNIHENPELLGGEE